MRILILDASTESLCSAAICLGDKVFQKESRAHREHAQNILGIIEECFAGARLAPADLDGVVFAQGPGSFTGIRVCAATAQGIALAAEIGLLPVSTLALMAQAAFARDGCPAYVVPVLAARRGWVYWGVYHLQDGVAAAAVKDDISPTDEVFQDLSQALSQNLPQPLPAFSAENFVIAGSGWTPPAEAIAGSDQAPPAEMAHFADILPHAAFGVPRARAATPDSWRPAEEGQVVYPRGEEGFSKYPKNPVKTA